MDVTGAILDERRDLVELLSGLSAGEWSTPSLCDGWTVHDVVAHLVTPYAESPVATVKEMVRHRSIPRAMQVMVERVGTRSHDELLTLLAASDVFVPPGSGPGAPLTDVIVHGADIRVPLGIDPDRSHDQVVRALDFVTSWRASPIFLPRRRLRGLELIADDADWSSGRGEIVRGRAIDLLLAVLGRQVGLDRLAGGGVGMLTGRLT